MLNIYSCDVKLKHKFRIRSLLASMFEEEEVATLLQHGSSFELSYVTAHLTLVVLYLILLYA